MILFPIERSQWLARLRIYWIAAADRRDPPHIPALALHGCAV